MFSDHPIGAVGSCQAPHFYTARWDIASEVAREGATGDGKSPANSSKAPVEF